VPHPTGLAYTFAFVMVAVSLYCVAWLFVATGRSRQHHVDVNVSHVAMGLAMSGMLVPRLNLLPDGLWEAVFVAIALWFSWQGGRLVMQRSARRDSPAHGVSHYLIHLVMALAMIYMYLAAVPAQAHTGSAMSMTGPTGAGANFVGLPLLFVLILFASAVWQLDGLGRYTPTQRDVVGVDTRTAVGSGARGSWGSAAVDGGDGPQTSETSSESSASLAPRLEMGCHIVMCITMGYMLILML
jgi:hypothetical protein